MIQFWHHIEHLLLLIQAQTGNVLLRGRGPDERPADGAVPRVELHLFYNSVVFIPMVIAVYLPPAAQPGGSRRDDVHLCEPVRRHPDRMTLDRRPARRLAGGVASRSRSSSSPRSPRPRRSASRRPSRPTAPTLDAPPAEVSIAFSALPRPETFHLTVAPDGGGAPVSGAARVDGPVLTVPVSDHRHRRLPRRLPRPARRRSPALGQHPVLGDHHRRPGHRGRATRPAPAVRPPVTITPAGIRCRSGCSR